MALPEGKSTTSHGTFHSLDAFSNEGYNRGVPWWKEFLWRLVSVCSFEGAWPLPSWSRVFWLRFFGAKIGEGVVIRSKVTISMPWRLTVGDHVWIGEGAFLLTLAPIEIGSHTCLSQRVFLCTGSHDHRSPTFDLITKPIRIGAQCWIAATAFVGPGVEVGEGTVVSAGSVLLESVPGGVIVRGNPAQVTGERTVR